MSDRKGRDQRMGISERPVTGPGEEELSSQSCR